MKRSRTIPENETAADRFKRLAEARVNKALKILGHIGNLASSQYESTPEQKTRIVEVLSDAVVAIEDRFNKNKATRKAFTL